MYRLVVFSGELSTKMMLEKDERVKVMAEILRGIRVIKFHVWEDHFVDRIGSEYGIALLAMTYNFKFLQAFLEVPLLLNLTTGRVPCRTMRIKPTVAYKNT